MQEKGSLVIISISIALEKNEQIIGKYVIVYTGTWLTMTAVETPLYGLLGTVFSHMWCSLFTEEWGYDYKLKVCLYKIKKKIKNKVK